MAASTHWRITHVETFSAGPLRLSALWLYDTGGRIDGSATVSSNTPPSSGSLANLGDADGATICEFLRPQSQGFYVQWAFPSDVEPVGLRIGGVDEDSFMASCHLECMVSGRWVRQRVVGRFIWPGAGSLTADPVGVNNLVPTTWNPNDKGGSLTLSNGNLTASANQNSSIRSVFGASTGKWYWECTFDSGTNALIGIGTSAARLTTPAYPGADANGWSYYPYGGGLTYHAGASAAYPGTGNAYGVTGVCLDMDNGTLKFLVDGVDRGVAFSGLSGTMYAMFGGGSSGAADTVTANFGATPFVHTPPAGYAPGFGADPFGDFDVMPVIGAGVNGPSAWDIGVGGDGMIAGTVSNVGMPNQPVYRRVRLHLQRGGRMVRETWSDPVTGAYVFENINLSGTYFVTAFDHTGLYSGVIETDITPEPMP